VFATGLRVDAICHSWSPSGWTHTTARCRAISLCTNAPLLSPPAPASPGTLSNHLPLWLSYAGLEALAGNTDECKRVLGRAAGLAHTLPAATVGGAGIAGGACVSPTPARFLCVLCL
jgi:hypothetical protein